MKKNKTRRVVEGAVIAALYAGLTLAGYGFSYGAVQFRISEALTILPIFTPAAIPGLAVGCFIANMASFNSLDLIFGTLATLLAAICTYLLRNIKWGGIPILSLLPPVIFNSLIIGYELYIFGIGDFGFLLSALSVGIGELVVCFALGIPLYLLVRKYRIFDTLE